MKRGNRLWSYSEEARYLGDELYEFFILENDYEYKIDISTGNVVYIYGEEAAATWVHECYRHPLVKIRAAKRVHRLIRKHNK